MLRHLHIGNIALLEEIRLEFQQGLTVLTGETGSGKSLVLESLGLLAGMRATPSLVRSGADRATVEALFEVPKVSALMTKLEELGLEPEEGCEIILRREILASGRSRASVNGRLVPLSQLSILASSLVEISGQHDQHRLLDSSVQGDLFDCFAGLQPKRKTVAAAYRLYRKAQQELDRMRNDERDRLQQIEFLRFQIEELESLGLQEGEWAELQIEQSRLSHLEELQIESAKASSLLTQSSPEREAALDLLGKALSSVGKMASLDNTIKPMIERLVEAQALLEETGYEIDRYTQGLEADPGRLDEVSDRMNALQKALRRFGPTEQDVLHRLEQLQNELADLDNWESTLVEREKQVAITREALAKVAKDLTLARKKARPKFLRPLTALLHDFSMPKARLEIEFRPVKGGLEIGEGCLCGATGQEELELMFSANTGEGLKPLRRIASGGELSRIMLALRTMAAEQGEVPLMVFDEVDAGISGTAARCVAERLAALGERCQVLCVTHNPSVASAADHHFLVEKHEAEGRTFTAVEPAEGLRREEELARLLDGGKGSQSGRALAAEMLQKAG
jgi:DNA repair protein RecN (Recombination protein N)